jgi:hypothetical protein
LHPRRRERSLLPRCRPSQPVGERSPHQPVGAAGRLPDPSRFYRALPQPAAH